MMTDNQLQRIENRARAALKAAVAENVSCIEALAEHAVPVLDCVPGLVREVRYQQALSATAGLFRVDVRRMREIVADRDRLARYLERTWNDLVAKPPLLEQALVYAERCIAINERWIEETRQVLYRAGHCGDGHLPSMVGRALREAEERRSKRENEMAESIMAALRACPHDCGDDGEGTLPELVRDLVQQRDEARNWVRLLSAAKDTVWSAQQRAAARRVAEGWQP